jgi:Flp pilus assembly secretin CpaC
MERLLTARGFGRLAMLLAILAAPVILAQTQQTAKAPSGGDEARARRAYLNGVAAEHDGKLEEAYAGYAEAADLVPGSSDIRMHLEKARFALTQSLAERAERAAVAGRLVEAATALRLALRSDPNNPDVQERLHQIERGVVQEATSLPEFSATPPHVAPQPGTRDINYRGDVRGAYSDIARRFGLLAVFDEDTTTRQIRFRLSGVDFWTAIGLLGDQTSTFWRAVDSRTFLVANDTTEKRRQYMPQIERTLVLPESERPEQMNEIARAVRELTGLTHAQVNTGRRSLTVRGSERDVALASELIRQLEQAHGEVMLEIEILELDRNASQNLGITPPTSAQIVSLSKQQIQLAQQSTTGLVQVIEQLFGAPTALPGSTPGQISTLLATGGASLASIVPPLIAFGGGSTVFLATLPGATANFAEHLSAVRTAQRVLLRAQDGEPASFFVGERFPISFSNLSNAFTISGSVPATSVFIFPTGASPRGIVTANLQGSAHLDLITANHDAGTVSVLLGNGNGTFGTNMDITVGNQPVALVAASFCSSTSTAAACAGRPSGTLDLAVANQGSNTVSILLGNGNGTFQTPVNYAVGTQPSGIVSADFNGDGHADLAVTNQGDNSISILLGTGDGTFMSAVNVPLAVAPGALEPGPIGIMATSLRTNNSHIDLITANSRAGTVSVLLGNGDGTFQPNVDHTVGTTPVALAAANFHGTSMPVDLAVANQGSNNVFLLQGNGDGTFHPAVIFAVGSQPNAIITGDFNNDGRQDMIVTNGGDNTATVFFGTGDGNFPSVLSLPTGQVPSGLASGDFNGDGLADVALTNANGNNVIVVINSNQVLSPNPQLPYPAVQFEDVGLKVKATPRIHSGGDVTLTLLFELRSFSTTSLNGIPVLNNRSVEQTVRLRVDETSVLGGIFADQKTRMLTGWPGVVNVPLLGSLLSNRQRQDQQTELVIVVTPRLVRLVSHTEEVLYIGRERHTALAGEGPPPEPGAFPQPGVQPPVEQPLLEQPQQQPPPPPP